MLNSERFLDAFCSIERSLRAFTKKEKGESFYSLVDIASELPSSGVRRFKEDLREYADLRNAIVHERSDGHVIAEPNDQAVEDLERIASLISNPPKVIPTFRSEVYTVSLADPIAKAVRTMFEKSFSQMPIDDGATLKGLLTADTIARWLGASVTADIFSLSETTVSDVLSCAEDKDNLSFLGKDSTLFEVLEKFRAFEKQGRRLEAILITEHGKRSEKPLGIITVWDLPRVYRELEMPRREPSGLC